MHYELWEKILVYGLFDSSMDDFEGIKSSMLLVRGLCSLQYLYQNNSHIEKFKTNK